MDFNDFRTNYNDDENNSSNDIVDLNSFSSSSDGNNMKKKNNKKKSNKFTKKVSEINKGKVLKVALAVFLIFVIIGCTLGGGLIFYAFVVVDSSMNVDLDNLELSFTTTIYGVDPQTGEYVEYRRLHETANRIWIDDENGNIPDNLKNAFIAVEDKTFRDHKGVNWKRTFSAFANLFLKFYSSNQGGSTITQQLVKNITMDNEAGGMAGINRKIREIMRARELEEKYSKDTILECYLNTIAMGHGIYGVEVAANYYFGKSAKDLNLAECASLAGITKNPELYRPDINPKTNKERSQTVLDLMLEQGFITQSEYDKAYNEKLNIVAKDTNTNNIEINSYFVDLLTEDVINDLMQKYGYSKEKATDMFYNSGLRIYSTVIPDVQNTLEKVFTSEEFQITNKDGDKLQGAMTVMDYKGNIVGIIGGLGEKTENRSFNRAVSSARQPGSSIKPLSAYAPAIENNLISYSTIVDDVEKFYKPDWNPNNWYKNPSYRGKITIEKALEISTNTIPVALVDQLTRQNSYDFVTKKFKLGHLNKNDVDWSPLGMGGTNGGVTTLEEAAAYATFGNGGVYYEPITYKKVTDADGNIILSNESKPSIAISEDTATIMNKLLQNVVYGPEGTGKDIKSAVKMKTYGKTGTSNEDMNCWITAGTPYYIASTWCGFDEYKPLTKSQAKTAKQIWSAVMTEVHKELKVKEFKDSTDVVKKKYCTSTGLLATENCPKTDEGWYKKKSLPSMCTSHPASQTSNPTDENNTTVQTE